MNFIPSPVEFSPPENSGSERPELYMIEGGAEAVPGVDDTVSRPDLYVVPDPEDIAEAGHEDSGEQDDTDSAAEAGLVLSGIGTGSMVTVVGLEQLGTSGSERYRRRGGGGSAIREFLRKLAAKEHESKKCSGCAVCET